MFLWLARIEEAETNADAPKQIRIRTLQDSGQQVYRPRRALRVRPPSFEMSVYNGLESFTLCPGRALWFLCMRVCVYETM